MQYMVLSKPNREMITLDVQLKKGLLDVAVLGVLRQHDSYGYELLRAVVEHVEISESTLYPILKRLEAAEQLSCYTEEHQGRLRKYYRLTDKGRRRIAEFINDWDEVRRIYDFVKGESDDE